MKNGGCCCDMKTGSKENGEDGSGSGCNTEALRMRARNEMGKLQAHEDEACANCRNRLTCGNCGIGGMGGYGGYGGYGGRGGFF